MADMALTCVINYLSDVLARSPEIPDMLEEVLSDLGEINVALECSAMKGEEELFSQIRDVAYEVEDIFDTTLIVEKPDTALIVKKPDTALIVKKPDTALTVKKPDTALTVKNKGKAVIVEKPFWRLGDRKPDTALTAKKKGKALIVGKPFWRSGDRTVTLRHTRLHEVSKKIKNLRNEIHKNFGWYGGRIAWVEANADAASTEAVYERREDEEDDVVGFDHDSTILVKQLVEGNSELHVVSIIGTDGSGKTTLARKIYNNVVIKSLFNCRAWVCISQNIQIRELLLEILKSAEMPKPDELTWKRLFKCLSEDELKRKLVRCLQGRRYLIVIEDIWKSEQWDAVSSVFPCNSNGSRILITSRIKEVALHASHTPYFLPLLNKDESWELFNKKVFRGGTCPPELEALGRKVVEDCRGLPLSIVVLGGFLANVKKTCESWSKLIGNVNWGEDASTRCEEILAFTYTRLSLHLKPCFLYFGVFPQGFEIPVRRLVEMWIAEGFIQRTYHEDPEDVAGEDLYMDPKDVAGEYLDDLIDRGLIQVASRRTDGGVKTCRIHHLLRDLCISESAKEKFLEVCTNFNLNLLSVNKSRRLSIEGSIGPYISSNPSSPFRSLLFLGQHTYGFDPNHWKWVLENFKLLRMLNFGCVDLYSVPTRIEELFHLRYLGIESDALKAIPASICKLHRLETLDLRGTFLNCLPESIWKMRHLKNLYMSGPVSLPSPGDCLDALESLQVLSTVSLGPNTFFPLFRWVKKLGLWFPSDKSKREVLDVLKFLCHLGRLETLKIINCSKYRCLQMLPSYDLWKLEKLTLRHVRLNARRDMILLGKLQGLKVLKLQSCLLCSKLRICANWGYPFRGSRPFLPLEVLILENLRIKNWKQCRRAMPSLKHLVIKQCNELTMLPSNRLSLTTLRNVEVLWSSPEAAKMLQELQVKVGFKLLIYPPLTDDLHETPAK